MAVLGTHPRKSHGWHLEFQKLEAAESAEAAPGISADPDMNKANLDVVKAMVEARELVDKAKENGQKLFLATEKQIESQMNTYLTEVTCTLLPAAAGLLRGCYETDCVAGLHPKDPDRGENSICDDGACS